MSAVFCYDICMKLRSIITFCIVIILLGLMVFALSISTKLVGGQRVGRISYSTQGMIGSMPLLIGFARTPAEWEKGLSGQKSLEANQGLLFLFKKPDYYGIWMKEMLFPIDVIWLDQSNQVIFMKSNFLPSSYPETAKPQSLALSVLEVPAGFIEGHQIHLGDKLIFAQN